VRAFRRFLLVALVGALAATSLVKMAGGSGVPVGYRLLGVVESTLVVLLLLGRWKRVVVWLVVLALLGAVISTMSLILSGGAALRCHCLGPRPVNAVEALLAQSLLLILACAYLLVPSDTAPGSTDLPGANAGAGRAVRA
jgi:hypothetical protein